MAYMTGYFVGSGIFVVPLLYYGTKRVLRAAKGRPGDQGWLSTACMTFAWHPQRVTMHDD